MAAISYPPTLPGPLAAPFQPAERRLLSTNPGPRDSRPLQLDLKAGQLLDFIYDDGEVEIFKSWVKDDLVDGGAWFAASWPQPQGGVGVRRFVGEPAYPVYYAHIGWHVSANVEVRGRGTQPDNAIPSSGFIVGGSIASGGDQAFPGSVAPQIRVGDALFLIAQDNRPFVTCTYPAGWELIDSRSSSGGTDRVTVLTRIADGTAADTAFAFAIDDVDAVADYHVLVLRNVVLSVGANAYPAYLSATGSFEGGNSFDPAALSPTSPAPWVNLLVNFSSNGAVDSGFGYTFVDPPAGYTPIANTATLFDPHYRMTMASAWSAGGASPEDPGSFSTTGTITTGGAGSYLFRFSYTPA